LRQRKGGREVGEGQGTGMGGEGKGRSDKLQQYKKHLRGQRIGDHVPRMGREEGKRNDNNQSPFDKLGKKEKRLLN